MKNTKAPDMRPKRKIARYTPKRSRLTSPPFGQNDSTKPKQGGIIFPSPLTGTVLAATAACFAVETVSTPLGTLVTAVDEFNWSLCGGLKYEIGNKSPSIPADQCKCKTGDPISWFGATD